MADRANCIMCPSLALSGLIRLALRYCHDYCSVFNLIRSGWPIAAISEWQTANSEPTGMVGVGTNSVKKIRGGSGAISGDGIL